MRSSVTKLEAFRRWRLNEDATVQDFLAYIQSPPSHRMNVGTAFHKILEVLPSSEGVAEYMMDGITFNFKCEAIVSRAQFGEVRIEKQYGPLMVSGKLDAIHGNVITDYKTTRQFEALNFLEGAQWKFYLDLYDADEFIWNVFVLKPLNEDETEFDVVDFHILKASRYPAMYEDCLSLAQDYYETLKEVFNAQ